MQRICFLRTDIDDLSGATIATRGLARQLSETPGYEAHIVSIYGSTEQGTEAHTSPTIPTSPEAPSPSEAPTIRFFRLNPGAKRLRERFFWTAERLRRYLKEQQIDVVFSVGISPLATLAVASRGMTVKRVLIEHSSRSNATEYGKADDLYLRLLLRRIQAVVTLTQRDRENYLTIYKRSPEKVFVIPNWVSESALRAAGSYHANYKGLISVGRPSKVKGYDLLVRVAQILQSQFPEWHWDIYGEDLMSEEVAHWIQEAGLDGFVTLKGNDPEILRRYREYSLFVMTSYYEGLPLSLLEARANHLPAIAFDCPTGPREVIADGVDGYLIPCYEVETMAQKLAVLMSNEDLRGQFSQASSIYKERFSKDHIFEQWLQLLQSLQDD